MGDDRQSADADVVSASEARRQFAEKGITFDAEGRCYKELRWSLASMDPYPRPLDGFGSDLLLALDDETMAVGYWSGDKFIIPDVVGPYTVTHWMPLPEGPVK